jgi:hypothetical protein
MKIGREPPILPISRARSAGLMSVRHWCRAFDSAAKSLESRISAQFIPPEKR